MQGWLVGIQIFVPFFVYNSIFYQSQLVMCIIFYIFNYSYFIKKVKSIHDKLSLVEYRIHKKMIQMICILPIVIKCKNKSK